ncbi:MAG: guanylate kinase, partial [Eubacteriaceae bacterium]|nr:guanylate kinase [Eubacteriaceae bacterium]
TRGPREGEENGVHYFFISREEFSELVERDAFYEHAESFGNCYGTLRSYVDDLTDHGYDVLLDIDVQGAEQVREKNPQAVLIFIMPPSLEELKKRLYDRHTESAEQLEKRIARAQAEMDRRDMYDHVIVNDVVERAYEELKETIESYRDSHEDTAEETPVQG